MDLLHPLPLRPPAPAEGECPVVRATPFQFEVTATSGCVVYGYSPVPSGEGQVADCSDVGVELTAPLVLTFSE
jgi:hypothetical protein